MTSIFILIRTICRAEKHFVQKSLYQLIIIIILNPRARAWRDIKITLC